MALTESVLAEAERRSESEKAEIANVFFGSGARGGGAGLNEAVEAACGEKGFMMLVSYSLAFRDGRSDPSSEDDKLMKEAE
jgi:hypothetical protein